MLGAGVGKPHPIDPQSFGFVSGHDFSRAVKRIEKGLGF
jgi:hypothetical protein